jgi:hypothetical protein
MTIGTALVIIAILYLIDKHNLWKRAAAVFLIALAVALVGFAGHYGWRRLQESHRRTAVPAEGEAANTEKHNEIDLSAGLIPRWNIPSPPRGFISDDAAVAVLDPIKADENAKTEAWAWYRDSKCVIVRPIGGPQQTVTHVLHERDLFSFESYDPRWLKGVSLGEEVKRALWNAKVKECQLPPGSKNVRACLDRATGTIDADPRWADYLTSCGPKREMIYLSWRPESANGVAGTTH